MDREVSMTVHLAVAMLSMSIVLSIVMGTVFIGNQLKADIIDDMVTTQNAIETGQLRELSTSGTMIMPRASIYSIVTKEKGAIIRVGIDGVDYTTDGDGRWVSRGDVLDPNYDSNRYVFPEDIILKTLEGKVEVFVDRNSYGLYSVYITSR